MKGKRSWHTLWKRKSLASYWWLAGASLGIGKATATLLAEKGFRVFGTSRRPKAEQGNSFLMLPLDVTSEQSVAICTSCVIEQSPEIEFMMRNRLGLTGEKAR